MENQNTNFKKMNEMLKVEMVSESDNKLNENTKVLMIIHPKFLWMRLYMGGSWLKGGPTLLF